MSAQWYHIGLQLKVRTGTLDRIRTQFTDPRDQLLETLKVWLTTSDNTSWMTLTDALRSRSVGATQLASVLETKYCYPLSTHSFLHRHQKQIALLPLFQRTHNSLILRLALPYPNPSHQHWYLCDRLPFRLMLYKVLPHHNAQYNQESQQVCRFFSVLPMLLLFWCVTHLFLID